MPVQRRRALFLAIMIGVVGLAVGCELIVDTSGLTGGSGAPDGGQESATNTADGTPPPATSDAGDAQATADVVAPSTCPTKTEGVAMVLVPPVDGGTAFCVDSAEVTGLDYAVFLDTTPPLSLLPADCGFKASYNSPGGDSVTPVHVDWCDAFAYCKWAGKRLCGKIGGGTNAFYDFDDATKSQWYAACSNHGALQYPYGQSFDPSRCNGSQFDAAAPLPPKSAPQCQGGVAGLYDMSGNVWEWEDSCLEDGGVGTSNDNCRVRGGCWVDDSTTLSCSYDYLNHFQPVRGAVDGHVGFRCCADL